MTGVELTAVWLFGIFCGSVTAASVAKRWWSGRAEVAKAHGQAEVDAAKAAARGHVDGYRAMAEVQHGPLGVPASWLKDGES